MAYEKRDNSGVLFRNEKRTQENHPHVTGKATVAGVDYWVSAWTKQRDNGEKYQSLSFKPVEEKQKSSKPVKDESGFDDMEDSLPF